MLWIMQIASVVNLTLHRLSPLSIKLFANDYVVVVVVTAAAVFFSIENYKCF